MRLPVLLLTVAVDFAGTTSPALVDQPLADKGAVEQLVALRQFQEVVHCPGDLDDMLHCSVVVVPNTVEKRHGDNQQLLLTRHLVAVVAMLMLVVQKE